MYHFQKLYTISVLGQEYTWVHVWVHRSKLGRRGVLEHKLGCTWVETAKGALCSQVLRSQACEAENLSAKCTECSFNPYANQEVAKYPDAKLARQGVHGFPLSWLWDESVEVLPLFWSTSYELTQGNLSSRIKPVIHLTQFWEEIILYI